MARIDEPLRIGNWLLPNRVVFQPMEGCDGGPDGSVGELTRRRCLRFAASGAAVVWLEAVSVCPEGRANPRQLHLNADTADSFARLLEDMRAHALREMGVLPKIIAQLTHSGRFAKPHGMPEPLVAYRNPLWERGREEQPYKLVADDDCARVVAAYAGTAKLAVEVGFDGIDVKCCHGYLLNEFLSAYDRPGPYGGGFENRARLFYECLEAACQSIPGSVQLTTRLNAYDGFPYPYGYGAAERQKIDLGECKAILRDLRDRFGVGLVNISLGNPYLIPQINRPARNLEEPGEVGMARIRAIMLELQGAFPALALVASGLSYPGAEAIAYANALLEDGAAALAGFGRMTFAYPQFYRDYKAHGLPDKSKACLACGKCTQLMRAGSAVGCPVRDAEAYMPYYQKYVPQKEA